MRRITAGLIACLLLFTSMPRQLYAGIEKPIRKTVEVQIGSCEVVTLEGNSRQIQSLEVAPFLLNQRTMVPLRFIVDSMGEAVDWNAENQTVLIHNAQKEITLVPGSATVYENGDPVVLDQAPVVRQGRTYVPVRFISESLGYSVSWDSNRIAQRIIIEDIQSRNIPHGATYDEAWKRNDQKTFAEAIKDPETAIPRFISEYESLAQSLRFIQNESMVSARNYRLYSPELASQENNLFLAMMARSRYLQDAMKGVVSYVAGDYYPVGEFYAAIENAEDWKTFQGKHRAARNQHYSKEDFVNFLDKADLPDSYLQGLNIRVLDLDPDGLLGVYRKTLVRGSYRDSLHLRQGESLQTMIATLAHELGHGVEKEVFRSYPKGDYLNGTQDALKEKTYANLYGKHMYEVSTGIWEDRLSENFAEDIASFLGAREKKRTSWVESGDGAVKAWLQEQIHSIEKDRIPLIRDYSVATDQYSVIVDSEMLGNLAYKNSLVSTSGTIRIDLNHPVHVSMNHVRILIWGEDQSFLGSKSPQEGVLRFSLPEKGKTYRIEVVQMKDNSSLSPITQFGSFYISYL